MLTTTLSIFWLTANFEDALGWKEGGGNGVLITTSLAIGNLASNTIVNINTTDIDGTYHYLQIRENNASSLEDIVRYNTNENTFRLQKPLNDSDEANREETNGIHSLRVVLPIYPQIMNNATLQIPPAATVTTLRTLNPKTATAIVKRSIEIPAYSRLTALVCCLIILTLGVLGNLMVSL